MAFSFKAAPTWQKGLIIVGGSAAAFLGYRWWAGRQSSSSGTSTAPSPTPSPGFNPLGEVGGMQGPASDANDISAAWQKNVDAQLAQANKEEQLLAQKIAQLEKQRGEGKPPSKPPKPPPKRTPPPIPAPVKGLTPPGKGSREGAQPQEPTRARNAASSGGGVGVRRGAG